MLLLVLRAGPSLRGLPQLEGVREYFWASWKPSLVGAGELLWEGSIQGVEAVSASGSEAGCVNRARAGPAQRCRESRDSPPVWPEGQGLSGSSHSPPRRFWAAPTLLEPWPPCFVSLLPVSFYPFCSCCQRDHCLVLQGPLRLDHAPQRSMSLCTVCP